VPPERLAHKIGSAGIGIPGVAISVVGPDGQPVSAGTVGEVVARGENVMRGYLDDPAATARALREGALHTGDLGYLDDEGFLFLVGRETDMIKSGGHRIGPHEIEEVVAEVPGVAECAVVGVPDELLGQAIVAFVVRDPGEIGAGLTNRAIQKACFERLPRFKMPAEVRFVDALPRSDRGKLLRSELAQGRTEGTG
jgi:acyl-CoA synthetase (AMP-forming)/AMP-acid ligase II